MGTLKGLASRMRRLASDLDKRNSEILKVTARAILMELINSTPVDTSQALSNWRVSLSGAYGAEAITAYYAGQAGSTAAASAGAAMTEADRVLRQATVVKTLVIFNATPYIRRLNEGSSAQAPAGFVEKAILAGRLAARAYKPQSLPRPARPPA